jgi:hypothetical protein
MVAVATAADTVVGITAVAAIMAEVDTMGEVTTQVHIEAAAIPAERITQPAERIEAHRGTLPMVGATPDRIRRIFPNGTSAIAAGKDRWLLEALQRETRT